MVNNDSGESGETEIYFTDEELQHYTSTTYDDTTNTLTLRNEYGEGKEEFKLTFSKEGNQIHVKGYWDIIGAASGRINITGTKIN